MASQVFRVGCLQCGTIQTEALDIDNDEHVAALGIIVAELLGNGHAVIVADDSASAGYGVLPYHLVTPTPQ